jgi:hypothetical protein
VAEAMDRVGNARWRRGRLHRTGRWISAGQQRRHQGSRLGFFGLSGAAVGEGDSGGLWV